MVYSRERWQEKLRMVLLPKELIQREVNSGRTAIEISLDRGCSQRLVEYRIQRCRLWDRYQRLTG